MESDTGGKQLQPGMATPLEQLMFGLGDSLARGLVLDAWSSFS